VEEVAVRTVKLLLKVGAVTLSPQAPYTWASGIKSPIYCDNRILISYPEVRSAIAEDLARLIRERYPEVEVLAATAAGAIPHTAWVAQRLGLPMVYVRPEPKDHGKRNLVEGYLKPGSRTVVVEDAVSTGGSCRRTVAVLRNEDALVLGVAAIFSFEFAGAQAAFARDDGFIDAAEEEQLVAWQTSIRF
jgi:orotate phosphoribosyltransferase